MSRSVISGTARCPWPRPALNYTLSKLTSSAWCFGVAALDSAGSEGALSSTGAVVIP
jgi:hypothetical protein